MSDSTARDDSEDWTYGDDKEGETTQYGVLVDSEAADFFRDMVKLANNGKIREKTGPELKTAMKYYTAVFFANRPYELDRVEDKQVDYIRNPEQFADIVRQWSEDVSADIARAGKTSSTPNNQSESRSADQHALFDEAASESETSSYDQDVADSDAAAEREKLFEAIRILDEFLERTGDEIPDKLVVDESNGSNERSSAPEDTHSHHDDQTHKEESSNRPTGSNDEDVIKNDK